MLPNLKQGSLPVQGRYMIGKLHSVRMLDIRILAESVHPEDAALSDHIPNRIILGWGNKAQGQLAACRSNYG